MQPFDFVVYSLSIHYLTAEEKFRLFQRIYDVLQPGGLFLNLDQIKGSTPWMENFFWQDWLTRVRNKRLPEERILSSIRRRTEFDKDATLAEQVAWLKSAGFADVDVVAQHTFIALFFARKPAVA